MFTDSHCHIEDDATAFRAGEAGVDGDLLYFMVKTFLKELAVFVISFRLFHRAKVREVF